MIPFTDFRNPVFTAENNSIITLEVLHPDFGWIEFAANPNDDVEYGVEVYNNALNGDYGIVAPYVDPNDTGL